MSAGIFGVHHRDIHHADYHIDQMVFDDYPESLILENFLDFWKVEFDDKLGQPIFRPLWKAMLKDIHIESCEKEGDAFRLIFDSIYKLSTIGYSGTTYFLEKELVVKPDPEHYRFIFPKVLECKNSRANLNVKQKNLNAIWGWDYHLGSCYTGVGYQTTWDLKKRHFVTDNINDAGWLFQKLATPQIKSLPHSLKDWTERHREPC